MLKQQTSSNMQIQETKVSGLCPRARKREILAFWSYGIIYQSFCARLEKFMTTAEKFNMGPAEIFRQNTDLRKLGDSACLNIRLTHADTESSILLMLNFVAICCASFLSCICIIIIESLMLCLIKKQCRAQLCNTYIQNKKNIHS